MGLRCLKDQNVLRDKDLQVPLRRTARHGTPAGRRR
jgi:hypothetical protein